MNVFDLHLIAPTNESRMFHRFENDEWARLEISGKFSLFFHKKYEISKENSRVSKQILLKIEPKRRNNSNRSPIVVNVFHIDDHLKRIRLRSKIKICTRL